MATGDKGTIVAFDGWSTYGANQLEKHLWKYRIDPIRIRFNPEQDYRSFLQEVKEKSYKILHWTGHNKIVFIDYWICKAYALGRAEGLSKQEIFEDIKDMVIPDITFYYGNPDRDEPQEYRYAINIYEIRPYDDPDCVIKQWKAWNLRPLVPRYYRFFRDLRAYRLMN